MTGLINKLPRPIGKTLQVDPVGYGCWRLVAMSTQDATARLQVAIEHGIQLIDTADVYGLDWGGSAFGESETLLGEVFQQAPSLRDAVVLATKGGIIPGIPYDSRNLIDACEASLTRLRIECIDLYQIHRPDLLAHPQDVAAQLETLRNQGKIREVGVSNYRPSQVSALQAYLDFPIATQQPEFSALRLDPLFDGTFDQCLELGQQAVAWSPLGGGRLATGATVPNALLERLDELAAREDVSRATLALAFTLAQACQPITLVGSIDPNRIAESTRARDVHLDAGDVYQIIETSMGEALP